jgi:regulator of nucleoside diphosphate kinase
MKQVKDSIILREDDYQVLISFLKDMRYIKPVDAKNIHDLGAELKKAKLVSKENFPQDVVRLNSKIKIMEAGKNQTMDIMLVTPDKADIKDKKISVMAPIGTAVLGFRQGQTISWKVPAGKRTFTIMEVINNSH